MVLSLVGSDRAVTNDDLTNLLRWDARRVEHLLNRAAFGGTTQEIEAGVRMGPAALLDELFRQREEPAWPEPVLLRWEDFGLDHMQLPLAGTEFARLKPEEQMASCKSAKALERVAFVGTFEQWVDAMVDGRDPLRDRMTLFWHGFFTTSWEVNRRKFELLHQFQWLHRNATGSYADLLRGIVADPAMLQYLDNTSNSRKHPNENLARELMELFSLGEGNYTETDVREAARALTGAVCTSAGTYAFVEEVHDSGSKLILGETGAHGPAELVAILLRQEACGRWVAGRLIEYFEGIPPSEKRLESYAESLRGGNFELQPFLRRLFTDPDFYRDEVISARVSAPIEHLASLCHKLDVHPSSEFLHRTAILLGQGFYFPPSVKGWREGLAWMSNDALMRRGNCTGLIVGDYGSPDLSLRVQAWIDREHAGLNGGPEEGAASWKPLQNEIDALDEHEHEVFDLRRQIDPRSDWKPWDPCARFLPRLSERGITKVPELVQFLLDEWLAISVPRETQSTVLRFVEEHCAELGVDPAKLLEDRAALTKVLPAVAHLVWSLPEAQLR